MLRFCSRSSLRFVPRWSKHTVVFTRSNVSFRDEESAFLEYTKMLKENKQKDKIRFPKELIEDVPEFQEVESLVDEGKEEEIFDFSKRYAGKNVDFDLGEFNVEELSRKTGIDIDEIPLNDDDFVPGNDDNDEDDLAKSAMSALSSNAPVEDEPIEQVGEDDELFEAIENFDNLDVSAEEAKELVDNMTEEELQTAAEYFVSGTQEAAEELMKQLKGLNLDAVDKQDNPEMPYLANIMEENRKRIVNIIETGFRDSDKVILTIFKEYSREPIRAWKTLKEEQLESSLKSYHIFLLFRLFASFKESEHLLPDLLKWTRANTDIDISPKIYDFSICQQIKLGKGPEAVAEIIGMRALGIKPLPNTYKAVLEYYSKYLIALCKKGELDSVRKTLRWLRKHQIYCNTEAYHEIVKSYIDNNLLFQARDVLTKMVDDGELPDKRHYAKIIGLYCDKNDFERAKSVLDEMDANGIYVPRSLSDIVIKGLSSSNEILAKEAQEDSQYRVNLKAFHKQMHETYQI